MIKKLIFLLWLFGFSFTYSQSERTIDSLQSEIIKFDRQKEKSGRTQFTLQDSTKCNLWIELAMVFNETNPQKALLITQNALDLSSKINYRKGIALSHNTFGKIYNGKADFNLAIKNITRAIKINAAINAEENLADSYFTLGQSYLFLNNYTLSLKNLNIALGKFQKLGKTSKEARIYNNIAILFGKLDNRKEELRYYNKALGKLKNDNSNYGQNLKNTVNTNIGNVYSDYKEFEKSNEILRENIDYVVKHDKINGLGLIYLRMGVNYMGLKDYGNSLAYLNNALTCFNTVSNKSGEGDALRTIGEAYYTMGQLGKAEEFTKKGLQLSEQIGELESIKFAYEILAKIYSKRGDYQKAYESQVQYKKVSDQMFNEQISSKLTQIQLSHEFERRQQANKEKQEKKDAILKKMAVREKRIRYIVILSLFVLSIVTLGVYVNLKRYKKQRNIIEKQKGQIQNSLQEKETLLREIHHRVKNNLQIITSLLNMQSENIKDATVLASLQEGQSRVQAMSLIHQNLYQSDEIDKVDVENYLRELADYLTKMFVGNSKNVKVRIQTSNIKFDFDTAIPLGLIVNELVSNAFKYGFQTKEEGNIWIKIRALNELDYELKIEDDGDGLPKDFNIKNSKSLGLKLVTILSKQLRGNFSVATKEGKTIFTVAFKDLKVYQSA
ncbi:tetratricopeptide repeat-containing sensor histidine kinase [Flavobacterium wongokense]|uniref:tetratricopeptide repeat-containing sensor histidine kinase n=1 Tax=Flavobacterium wongokense TaxID=2910674 RepID=UPI001F36EDC0|nr:histidine kinase dimerization/phosphoacceptor domain -containing protein [Flavobacterium sp. WG47]MCF6133184.1 tetratricopeptide repeat protein [Flavobacterium sp. WG47]